MKLSSNARRDVIELRARLQYDLDMLLQIMSSYGGYAMPQLASDPNDYMLLCKDALKIGIDALGHQLNVN